MLVERVNLAAVMVVAEAERVAQAALQAEALILLMVVLEFHHLYLAHRFNMLAEALVAFHQIMSLALAL
jgi:hypothetical protein